MNAGTVVLKDRFLEVAGLRIDSSLRWFFGIDYILYSSTFILCVTYLFTDMFISTDVDY
jgi:hypothetical protein